MALLFEYHTFLHHSQTIMGSIKISMLFEYHTFLHHSQTIRVPSILMLSFEYHTFLHHSQTYKRSKVFRNCLSTIHFYIILKLALGSTYCSSCLSTIHFYIILKLYSDSNRSVILFEYHTFLHHSQTSNSKMKCHHSHKIQVLKLLGCYISHPSLSIIYLVTPSMQSLAQVSINKS